MAAIDSILICDDIREEVGDKVSLIGLYADKMVLHEVLPEFPKVLAIPKLVFAVLLDGLRGIDQMKLDVVFTRPNGEQHGRFEKPWRKRPSPDNDMELAAFPAQPFPVPEAGVYTVTVNLSTRTPDPRAHTASKKFEIVIEPPAPRAG